MTARKPLLKADVKGRKRVKRPFEEVEEEQGGATSKADKSNGIGEGVKRKRVCFQSKRVSSNVCLIIRSVHAISFQL